MKKEIRRAIFLIVLVFTVQLVGCGNVISEKDKKEIKTVVDKVLSNEGLYTGEVTKFVGEETYYTSNYFIFYSMFLNQPKLTRYDSELRNITKKGDKYEVCIILDMEAESVLTNSEEGEKEQHNDTASGENVPVELILKEKDDSFYIISSKEYDNLEMAIKNNEGFKVK